MCLSAAATATGEGERCASLRVVREKPPCDDARVPNSCLPIPVADTDSINVSANSCFGQEQVKCKKGRPRLYKSDCDNTDMTEAERRHLRRIVSNRRSAQRVRERKSAVMRDMEVKIAQLVGDNACIACHIAEVEACNNKLRQQISICEAMRQDAVASNEQLSKDVKLLATRLLDVATDEACYQLDCKEASMGSGPAGPAQTDSDMACNDGNMADCLVARTANALAANLPMMVMRALC
ncbi:TPA: hypothetical protein ACH3X2_003232 [Trebouxia sp. C0005]